MSKTTGGRSSDCPDANFQYCPLGQLEKLEAAAASLAQGCAACGKTVEHLNAIIREIRQHGLQCASGPCQMVPVVHGEAKAARCGSD